MHDSARSRLNERPRKHRIKIGRLIHALVDRDGSFLLMCCENAYAGLSGHERLLDGWHSIVLVSMD